MSHSPDYNPTQSSPALHPTQPSIPARLTMLPSLPSLPELSAMPSKILLLWDHFSPNPTSAIILDDLNISMNHSIALAKTSYRTIYGKTRTTFWPTQYIQMSNLGGKLTWQQEQGRKCG